MLEHKLKKLLADQHLVRSVVVEQEEYTHALQVSHQEELQRSNKRTFSQAW